MNLSVFSKPLKWLVIMTCLIGIIPMSAQRVFVISETGVVQEVKQGSTGKRFFAATGAILTKNRPVIIPKPLKIYVKTDVEFDPTEWYVGRLFYTAYVDGPAFMWNHKYSKGFSRDKRVKFNSISENLVEFELSNDYSKNLSGYVPNKEMSLMPELVIIYNPSKKSKKEGKERTYWYVKMSENDYDPDDTRWSSTQVEFSINELIATKRTSKQLFASIAPQEIPQSVLQNGNVQYVVVQQPPQSVVTAPISPTPQITETDIESDIDIDIPYTTAKSENSFALIIANEDYNKVASVPFAKRDGKLVSEYLTRSLGFDKGHVTLLENATLNDLKYELNRLSKISEAYGGEANIIIYYSGHGIPDEKNGNGYLLPVDGYGNDVSTAYSTQELYDLLGSLKSRRTLLFMDACFSGASKNGDMLVAARGIAIKSTETTPSGNLITFSACQGDETAYPYKEKGHGLMTYYLLKKIQETKGNVSLGELEQYLTDNVRKASIVINGKPQTPFVGVSPILQDTWKEALIMEK